jgi:fermentation-respiration switch protein FrsA (DUF1100 family)
MLARQMSLPPKKRSRKRAVLTFVGLLLGLWLMLRWFEHSQVYHPTHSFVANAGELGRPYEDAVFTAVDGTKLHGWFFPGTTNSPHSRQVIIVCHGNGGNISHRVDLCGTLLETGVSVLSFDYRGYGRSEGRPSEAGTYADAEAAYDWLRGKGFAPEHVIAYGESLGGGVATELAVRRPTGGLILQSTFTSIPAIGAELFPWLPVKWLSRIQYATSRKLPSIKVPVLVMHSKDDGMIAYHHAETNFAAANQPKLFCEINGNHNYPLMNRSRFMRGIEDFLALVDAQPTPQSAR